MAMPPNRTNPRSVVATFLIWPVMDVVSGELIVEHRKMSQFSKNACTEDMRKQNCRGEGGDGEERLEEATNQQSCAM